MNDDQFDRLYRQGTKLLHKGEIDRAARLLQRAHQLDPAHLDAAINLSGVYILKRQFKKAVQLLEPLSRSDPDHVMIWTNLGAAYLGNPVLARAEDQERAIAAFQRALEINPIAPNVAYNLGLIYRDRQDYRQAVYWFRRALQANPNDQDARNLIQRLSATSSPEGGT